MEIFHSFAIAQPRKNIISTASSVAIAQLKRSTVSQETSQYLPVNTYFKLPTK